MRRTGDSDKREGRRHTFHLRIYYRQHATWQGSLQWLEGKKIAYFRSPLEMCLLMREAAGDGGEGKMEAPVQEKGPRRANNTPLPPGN